MGSEKGWPSIGFDLDVRGVPPMLKSLVCIVAVVAVIAAAKVEVDGQRAACDAKLHAFTGEQIARLGKTDREAGQSAGGVTVAGKR